MIFKGEEKIVGIRRLNVGFITRVSNNTTCKEKKRNEDGTVKYKEGMIFFVIIIALKGGLYNGYTKKKKNLR